VPNAGHHRILVHVETGAMWVQNLHIPPLLPLRLRRGIPSNEL
jgi:hypothetical protein